MARVVDGLNQKRKIYGNLIGYSLTELQKASILNPLWGNQKLWAACSAAWESKGLPCRRRRKQQKPGDAPGSLP